MTVTGAGGTQVFQARKGIVINTGTEPAIPPLPGLASTPYWTNREIVQAERVPESLIVLGGGAIGAELAQDFARFGTAVTVIEALPRLVSFEEPEASELIERVFATEGITVRTQARAEKVSYDGRGFTLVSRVSRGELRERSGATPPAPFREVCEYLATLPDIEAIQAIAFPVRPKG